MVANIVALGAIAELTGIVSHRGMEKALMARVPSGSEPLNRKALHLGARLVTHYQQPERRESPDAADEDDV